MNEEGRARSGVGLLGDWIDVGTVGTISDASVPVGEAFAYAVLVPDEARDFGRARGTDRVLYVGSGTRGRVCDLTRSHSARRALLLALGANDRLARAPVRVLPCRSTVAARIIEAVTLSSIARLHGELPPANARWEGFAIGRILRELALVIHGRESRAYVRVYDWPDPSGAEPNVTWAEVWTPHGAWRGSLGWFWPAASTEQPDQPESVSRPGAHRAGHPAPGDLIWLDPEASENETTDELRNALNALHSDVGAAYGYRLGDASWLAEIDPAFVPAPRRGSDRWVPRVLSLIEEGALPHDQASRSAAVFEALSRFT